MPEIVCQHFKGRKFIYFHEFVALLEDEMIGKQLASISLVAVTCDDKATIAGISKYSTNDQFTMLQDLFAGVVLMFSKIDNQKEKQAVIDGMKRFIAEKDGDIQSAT